MKYLEVSRDFEIRKDWLSSKSHLFGMQPLAIPEKQGLWICTHYQNSVGIIIYHNRKESQ